MQRFYQAVELDEAEIARKRNARVNSDLNKRPKSVERTKEDNEFELVNNFHFFYSKMYWICLKY